MSKNLDACGVCFATKPKLIEVNNSSLNEAGHCASKSTQPIRPPSHSPGFPRGLERSYLQPTTFAPTRAPMCPCSRRRSTRTRHPEAVAFSTLPAAPSVQGENRSHFPTDSQTYHRGKLWLAMTTYQVWPCGIHCCPWVAKLPL